ncbi:MAG: pyridoxamine 5'-phosphate oxidase family protein [Rhizobiales bacterium]|nr:pyridoxamine 5'-phosphate oxidase family protein [Hyphomicrobiales bacterium]
MSIVTTLAELEHIYSATPTLASLAKEVGFISPHYRKLIESSPFAVLATMGPEGLDCSPRGDRPGFVRIQDERTLVMPDRHGNNRIDSLRNILRDPRVALLFLIPGSGTTFRVNGKAVISADPDLLASFAVDGKPPCTALVITVEAAYFQCARAIIRSGLWDATRHVDASAIPTPGDILEALSKSEIDGHVYDVEWPARASKTLW